MEEFKKGYAAASVKVAAYLDGSNSVAYTCAADEVEEIIGIMLYALAGVMIKRFNTAQLHAFANEMKGLFLQACVDAAVHTEGGGVFGNDHFKN